MKNRIVIALGLIAAAAVLLFLFLKPKKAAAQESQPTGGTGWRQAAPKYYSSAAIRQMGTSVTDQGNRLKVTLGSDVAKTLFGNANTNVFLPKTSGAVAFNAAPELLSKLTAKYGEGKLFQKGKNLTEGFEWATAGGSTQLTFKDFIALSK